MLINRPIPNFFNGISQQSASLRLPTQAEIQENAYSSIVEGLKKRPPTNHLAKLSAAVSTDVHVHTINRDITERYIVIISNGDLAVYNLAGTAMTVLFPSGKAYLAAATPRTDFDVLTVADYTFIANKNFVTAMTATVAGGTAMGSKQTFTALPGAPAANDVWKIDGDPNNNFDNYYVKWNAGLAVWEECPKVGVTTTIDGAKMPWKLTRTGVNQFTFDKITWNDRLVGDDISAAPPSFIGNTINGIFYHRNRLGFISDENVIFSCAGDFFNFFPATVTTVLDSDPVDVAVTHTKVSILRHAIPFNTSLILFSDLTQFQLSAKDLLTPKTVNVNPTTEFEASRYAKPVGAGQSLYFAVEKGSYAALKEYTVQPLTFTNEAADVTAHVPKYLPANLFKLVACNNDDVVFGLTLNERNAVYTYKYYWGDEDKKIQSSWSKWTFDAGDTVLGMDAIGSNVYFVIQRADGVYLESCSIQAGLVESDLPFLCHLDRKTTLTGSYSAITGLTTWTLPYADTGTFQVILGGLFTGQAGNPASTLHPTSTTLTASGDYSAHPCYVGRTYQKKYRLSQIYYRDDNKVSVTHYQVKLKNIQVIYKDTGYFRVVVTPTFKSTYTYVATGKVLGSGAWVLGTVPLGSGSFTFPVLSDSTAVTIDFINDSYLPSYLQSAEWEAFVSTRSKRV